MLAAQMARVRLIHWKAAEAAPVVARLERVGHTVDYVERPDQRVLRAAGPEAIVIHLGRLPSHGREVGVWLRQSKATRAIPLLFAGGEPDKIDRVREVLPDAVFTDDDAGLLRALKNLSAVTALPPRPAPEHAKPLSAKLGLQAGMKVQVIDAPGGFIQWLAPLTADLEFTEEPAAFTLAFQHDAEAFRAALPELRRAAERGKLWIGWRKQASRKHDTALTATSIREAAARYGLVDYKICALNAEWSAMAFGKRRERS